MCLPESDTSKLSSTIDKLSDGNKDTRFVFFDPLCLNLTCIANRNWWWSRHPWFFNTRRGLPSHGVAFTFVPWERLLIRPRALPCRLEFWVSWVSLQVEQLQGFVSNYDRLVAFYSFFDWTFKWTRKTYSIIWSPWSVGALLVESLHIVQLHDPVEIFAPPFLCLPFVECLPTRRKFNVS